MLTTLTVLLGTALFLHRFQSASGLFVSLSKTFIFVPVGIDIDFSYQTLKSCGTNYLGFCVNGENFIDKKDLKVADVIAVFRNIAKDYTLSIFGKANAINTYGLSKLWFPWFI